MIKTYVNVASIVTGSLSALIWLFSATVKVLPPNGEKDGTYWSGLIVSDGADLLKTLKAQSRWNKYAAAAAAITATLQVIATYLPDN